MMFGTVMSWYHYLLVNPADRRVDTWPLMSSIWPTTGLCLLYLFLVRRAGPWFMKNRQPQNLQSLMMVYNFLQTLLSLYIFLEIWTFYISPGGYSWHCQPVDYSSSPTALRALNVAYIYYLSKFVDFFDSFFFVVRKKFDHLSTLHVVHHCIMPWACWFGPKFVGGGHSGFGPFLNSGVHVVMYLYYFLSACGPRVRKHLWWKKYLTTLQMVQFVVVTIHQLQPLFFDCDYPRALAILMIFICVLFWILFLGFYRKEYAENKKKQ